MFRPRHRPPRPDAQLLEATPIGIELLEHFICEGRLFGDPLECSLGVFHKSFPDKGTRVGGSPSTLIENSQVTFNPDAP
jgi:hypothetical protein